MSGPEIKPTLTDDGKAKCSCEECPQYRKSTFEQYSPSTCEVGGGAGYAPENLCTTWYLREVERLTKALERCGDWDCCHRDELMGEACYETDIGSDSWCPICYGHATVNPDGVPARRLKEEGNE